MTAHDATRTSPRLRLVAVGDIGSIDAYHVGDEAMMAGLVQDMASSSASVEWTVMATHAERWSARCGQLAVPRLTFTDCADADAREMRLAEFDAVISEPPDRWASIAPPQWRDALSAIAASDGVVIAGGGNLSRAWPDLVFERAAVVRAANRAKRPVAITSQTIGPSFDDRTRELVAELLAGSVSVGVREERSHRVARDLGVAFELVQLHCDGATSVDPVEPAHARDIVGGGPFIAVTINQIGDASDPARLVARLATELAELGRRTGAAIVLVPHVGDLDGSCVHDVAVHAALAAAAGHGSPLRLAPLPSPQEAVWYSAHAQLVISTRYHPVVFACANGTPSLFLYQDHYTLVKGQGALALAGLQDWVLSVGLAATGLLVPAGLELWSQRGVVSAHLRGRQSTFERSERARTSAVLASFMPGTPSPSVVEIAAGSRGPCPQGEWVDAACDALGVAHAQTAEANWELERDALARELAMHRNRFSQPDHRDMPPDLAQRTPVIDVCTIVARNYLPYARVLMQSLKAVHPGARATVLVVDGDAPPGDASLFRSLRLEDVIPDAAERRHQTLIYDVMELSTAVKPLLLQRLLSEGAGAVLYFDPDIQIFDSIEGLWRLARERGIVLTPHTIAPIPDDGLEISDLTILRAGVYNLGFIGVGPGSVPFLEWWASRLRRHCISDPANGAFVDQRWIDYVPGFFPHAIVRDPGCNVAYWNLHERCLRLTAAGFEVNGEPLRFYHFSGIDADVPHLLSKHQGRNPRVLLSEQPALRELCADYTKRLKACGSSHPAEPYGFANLPDGTPVDKTMRRLYRRALLEAERLGSEPPPSPFEADQIVAWLNATAPETPRLSRFQLALYQERPDLQRAFPQLHGAGAEEYIRWFKYDPTAMITIPATLQPNGTSASSPGEDDSILPSGLNIVGYFKTEQGVGEIARLVAAAARAADIPTAVVVNGQTLGRQQAVFELGSNGGPYDTTLICANADELPRTMDALPRMMADRSYRIGFWFWETAQLPDVYQSAAELVEEVWVASEYVAAAVRATIEKPVYICPVPLRKPDPAVVTRAELGVPEGFLFLFMFDFLSNVHRKNPIGLIDAFCQAFRPGEGPTLILKSINGNLARGPAEAVRAAIADRPDIVMMDGYLSAGLRDGLMNACDCYVSLHRSEGLGLTLAEAMALGKPTIATAYSGNLEFMTPENSFLVSWRPTMVPAGCEPYPKGDYWAQPDLAEAASLMRCVYENPELAHARGRTARAHVSTQLSQRRTSAFMTDRLEEIRHLRDSVRAELALTRESERVIGSAEPGLRDLAAREPATPSSSVEVEPFPEMLDRAERYAGDVDRLLAGGIPFGTPSRFGWPGRMMRTAVLRILRPYTTFAGDAHQQHLQSTIRALGGLRQLEREVSRLRERLSRRSPDTRVQK